MTSHATTARHADPAPTTAAGRHPSLRYHATAWIALHLLPAAQLPLLTVGLAPRIGLDAAAALTHLTAIGAVAVLQFLVLRRLLRETPAFAVSRAWSSWTAVALGCGVGVGTAVMSTVDLAGHDGLATFAGMAAAGIVVGMVQVRQGGPAAAVAGRWLMASALGWVVGAALYRLLLPAALRLSLSGMYLYGHAYHGGHNELLWVAAGLLGYGVTTGALALPALRRNQGVERVAR